MRASRIATTLLACAVCLVLAVSLMRIAFHEPLAWAGHHKTAQSKHREVQSWSALKKRRLVDVTVASARDTATTAASLAGNNVADLSRDTNVVLNRKKMLNRNAASDVTTDAADAKPNARAIQRLPVDVLQRLFADIKWSPISIEPNFASPESSLMTLCKLKWSTYRENAQTLPFSGDLIAASDCGKDGNSKVTTLAELARVETEAMTVAKSEVQMEPTGFIFHVSRCGSTQLANTLSVSPNVFVYAESHLVPEVLLWLTRSLNLSDAQKLAITRTVVRRMCLRQRAGEKGEGTVTSSGPGCFFKFQSHMTNAVFSDLLLRAFPKVPFVVLYRNPVEVLVSHLQLLRSRPGQGQIGQQGLKWPGQGHGGGGRRGGGNRRLKCLHGAPRNAAMEDLPNFCAASVGLRYTNVLNLLRKHSGGPGGGGGTGVALEYGADYLRDFVHVILPTHFNFTGVTESASSRSKLPRIFSSYSKQRPEKVLFRPSGFAGDTYNKQAAATSEIRQAASKYMGPSHAALSVIAAQDLVRLTDSNPYNMHSDAEMEYSIKSGGEYLPYPKLRPLTDILHEWPPDSPDVPAGIPGIQEGTLEHFSWRNATQMQRAARLRLHEVPFVVTDVPGLDDVVGKYANDSFLASRMGGRRFKVTTSGTNHFMYYSKPRKGRGKGGQPAALSSSGNLPSNFVPPTGVANMTFSEWLATARAASTAPVNTPHYYLQLGGHVKAVPKGSALANIMQDLSSGPGHVLRPDRNFWMGNPKSFRGINCRFGARGIIAEAHWDGGRNFVAMLRGAKRYILVPPKHILDTYLIHRPHPQARHSEADWSRLNLETYPNFMRAQAAQVVVRAGEILYIPSFWIHYIVSIDFSVQCNGRSGTGIRGEEHVRAWMMSKAE